MIKYPFVVVYLLWYLSRDIMIHNDRDLLVLTYFLVFFFLLFLFSSFFILDLHSITFKSQELNIPWYGFCVICQKRFSSVLGTLAVHIHVYKVAYSLPFPLFLLSLFNFFIRLYIYLFLLQFQLSSASFF